MAPPRPPGPSGSRRPPGSARRHRSGPERPINARLVRGTWLLVALPLLLAAFTIGRPVPLAGPTLPAAFDADIAASLARELTRDYPDRAPGSPGSLGAAQWFEKQMALYGFETTTDAFAAHVPGQGRVQLRNLVAVAPGPSQSAIVFLAHRDNTGESGGANDNASGTAALIELARAYAPITGTSGARARPAHTLVFVSTDGGAYGAIGAARFAERSPYGAETISVVSLDGIAGLGGPRLLIAGDTRRSPTPALVRTAAVRLLEQTGDEPARPGLFDQLVDLGFPLTFGEQGPFVARGIPAVTIATGPQQPLAPFAEDTLDVERLAETGRAAQNLLGSLDGGLELSSGTASYVYLGRRLVRGWAIELALIAGVVPFAIGAVDLFARLRRRRIPLGDAARSLRRRLGFWAYGALLLFLGGLAGIFPNAEARPLPPNVPAATDPPTIGVVLLAIAFLAGWLVSRERLLPRRPARPGEELAGFSVALLGLGVLALLVIATNPFALVFLLPSLYAWLWLPQARTTPARVALLLLGFAAPALMLSAFADRYALGYGAVWYLLSLVGVGYVPWLTFGLVLGWCAIAGQLSALAIGRYAPYAAGPGHALLGRFAPGRAPEADVEALEQ